MEEATQAGVLVGVAGEAQAALGGVGRRGRGGRPGRGAEEATVGGEVLELSLAWVA